ncbi:hypothetical protein [Rhodopseudomonas palustris]|uniref:hypothetical protein n=1 Tax=Rhodopseudomonas palustris TaxID=1076 RepID=UPI001F3C9789|nr:hypothetical protein [Rhodopseudomonas palustris]
MAAGFVTVLALAADFAGAFAADFAGALATDLAADLPAGFEAGLLTAFLAAFGGLLATAFRALDAAAPFPRAAPEDLDFGAVFFFEAALAMAFNGPRERNRKRAL